MNKINIQPLKAKALKWPEPLKTVILSENDELDPLDLIAKMGTWDRLLKMTTAEALKNEK